MYLIFWNKAVLPSIEHRALIHLLADPLSIPLFVTLLPKLISSATKAVRPTLMTLVAEELMARTALTSMNATL